MRLLLKGFLAVPLLILFSCSAPVDIEGDVFLVKGDGKPQPSAAKEVIFVEGLSLEDVLIKAYLESVSNIAQENSLAYKELCNSSSELQQSHILKLEEAVNKSTKEGVDKNIVDQEGSCSSLQEQLKSAKSLSSGNEERFNNLIASEQSKITKAKTEKARLNSILEKKITNKEKALYKEFMKNIKISTRVQNKRSSYNKYNANAEVIVVNNSQFNIKIKEPILIEYYNSEGDPVGTTSNDSLYDCSFNPGRMQKGLKITLSSVNLSSKDSYGFTMGGYLPKGGSQSRRSPYNSFCPKNYISPEERMKMSKKYGEDKKGWPDLSLPDFSKGYKIKSGTFIPLEDEVRVEKGSSVTYTSKEISFREIAKRENYIERGQIKTQEKIVETAKKQIRKIEKESNEDPAIAKSFNTENLLLACTSHLDIIKEKKKEIESRQSSLDVTTKCDISEPKKLSDSFILEKEGDISKLKNLMNADYSSVASLGALNVFADSPFRTSTNISGHYSLKEVPPGNYVIYSSYQDNFNEGIYLINKEIKEGVAIDLSNANFYEVGSLVNVLDIFYEKCSEKVCGEEDLRNTLDIQEAVRRNKERMKALEDLEDSLERIKNLLDY